MVGKRQLCIGHCRKVRLTAELIDGDAVVFDRDTRRVIEEHQRWLAQSLEWLLPPPPAVLDHHQKIL